MRLARLRDWLRFLADRLGLPGLIGLALAIAAALTLALLPGLDAERQRLEKRIAAVRDAAPPAGVEPGKAQALALLPAGHDLAPLVAAIHEGARRHRIRLQQGEYAWHADAGGSGRYRMVFPAQGTYPQLRRWTEDVLAAQPGLAVEQLDFWRQTIASTSVEVRVRFAVRTERKA
jgi:hypothetical protein